MLRGRVCAHAAATASVHPEGWGDWCDEWDLGCDEWLGHTLAGVSRLVPQERGRVVWRAAVQHPLLALPWH